MPKVNPEILTWARDTAGLSLGEAVEKLGINDARGVAAVDRLAAIESGAAEPSRPLLLKMAQRYRRPLVAFYCPPSVLMRQIGWVEEGRISGSS
jgi:transcriptional regulator with XRE-family HTH domain